MGIFKEQRFRHSNEVKKHLKDEHQLTGTDYRDGKRSGTWYNIGKDEHLHVKNGKIGPAANMFIVSMLSCAGLLALAIIFFLGT